MTSGVGKDGVAWGYALWLIMASGVGNLICFAVGRYYVNKLHSALYLQDLLQDSDTEGDEEEDD